MRKIYLNVCQGIGDIFWIYQKFFNHFDKINFNIITIPEQDYAIKTRAIPFLTKLSKVGNVTWTQRSKKEYEQLARNNYSMNSVIEAGGGDFACNSALERGIRLEDIDPDYSCAQEILLPRKRMVLPDEYVLIYVSGTGSRECWSVEGWQQFITGFMDKFGLKCPLVFLGASYDREVLELVGLSDLIYVDLEPEYVIDILARAKYFLAYQSGLSILADMLNVKQVMLYYKWLDKLRFSWARKENLNSLYHAYLWEDTVKGVLDRLTFSQRLL